MVVGHSNTGGGGGGGGLYLVHGGRMLNQGPFVNSDAFW